MKIAGTSKREEIPKEYVPSSPSPSSDIDQTDNPIPPTDTTIPGQQTNAPIIIQLSQQQLRETIQEQISSHYSMKKQPNVLAILAIGIIVGLFAGLSGLAIGLQVGKSVWTGKPLISPIMLSPDTIIDVVDNKIDTFYVYQIPK